MSRTAPTPEEIRAVVERAWNAWHRDRYDPSDRSPYSGKLEDLVAFDLLVDVMNALWAKPGGDGTLTESERYLVSLLKEVVQDAERRILDGAADAFRQYAERYPNKRRARATVAA